MMFIAAKPATAIALMSLREAGSPPCAATSDGEKGRASNPAPSTAATIACASCQPSCHSAVRRRVVKFTRAWVMPGSARTAPSTLRMQPAQWMPGTCRSIRRVPGDGSATNRSRLDGAAGGASVAMVQPGITSRSAR